MTQAGRQEPGSCSRSLGDRQGTSGLVAAASLGSESAPWKDSLPHGDNPGGNGLGNALPGLSQDAALGTRRAWLWTGDLSPWPYSVLCVV